MNRRQAITKACLLLKRQAKEESLARFLLMYMLDEMREFNENLALELTEEDEQKYFQLINKHIKDDTPLSHLVGFEYFYDRKFKVTSDVLSPRMETEELVYKVIDHIRKNNLTNIKILDLCTGSGIIGITLKKELEEFTNAIESKSDRTRMYIGQPEKTIKTNMKAITQIANKYNSKIVGKKVNNFEIKEVSEHIISRTYARNLDFEDIQDTLNNPLDYGKIKTDNQGRKSINIYGKKVTVSINPDTGKLATARPTNKRELKRYEHKE